MKKIILSIIVLGLFITSIFIVIREERIKRIEEPQVIIEKTTSLMKFGKYKNIQVSDIDYIEVIRYTIAGRDSNKVESRIEIQSIYNRLDNKLVGSRTEMACEDNTTIYRFHMKDDTNVSIEIECGVLVMGRNRYILK